MTNHVRKFKNGIYRNTLRVKADRPNINDLRFKNAYVIDRAKWKAKTDNAANMPPPFDQGELGSCTANSLANHVRYVHKLSYAPSRLYIYYNERALEGTIQSDAGAELRDGIKVIAAYGVIPEKDWPYDISKFKAKPPSKLYEEGKQELVHKYFRVADIDDLKQSLNDGYLVSFGFTCYETFESQKVADTAFLPLPQAGEQAIGGHAVLAVDYGVASDWLSPEVCKEWNIPANLEVIKVLNSWGEDFGQKGYFFMPLDYFKNSELVTDLWTIRPN